MSIVRRVAAVLASGLLVAAGAQAGTVTLTLSVNQLAPATSYTNDLNTTRFTQALSFDPFNTTLGTLTSVTLLTDLTVGLGAELQPVPGATAPCAQCFGEFVGLLTVDLGADQVTRSSDPVSLTAADPSGNAYWAHKTSTTLGTPAGALGPGPFNAGTLIGSFTHTGTFPYGVAMNAVGTISLVYAYDPPRDDDNPVPVPGTLALLAVAAAAAAGARRRARA